MLKSTYIKLTSFLTILMMIGGLNYTYACDLSGPTIVGNYDNGDGTYTVELEICAAVDIGNGSTTGISINTGGNNILSFTPGSITGNAGNTKTGTLTAADELSYGDPTSGSNLTDCCACDGSASDCWTVFITVGSDPGGDAWEITGAEGVGSPCTYSETIPTNAPNPSIGIKMTYFNVQCQSSGNMVRWSAVSDNRQDYFVLQRSADGRHYDDIHREPVRGDAGDKNYTYLDNDLPISEKLFYRVKMINTDEDDAYSRTVEASGRMDAFMISPVPVHDQLNVTIYYDKETITQQVSLMDLTGKVVKQINVSNKSTASIDVKDLTNGIYFLRMTDPNTGRKVTKKFIKN